MTLRLTVSVIVSLLSLFTTTQLLQAQTASELRDAGIRAYGDLDLDFAMSALRLALQPSMGGALVGSDRSEALAYLAAAELLGGNRDSATAVFRRLAYYDFRYDPDPLIFPPRVTGLHRQVLSTTRAIALGIDSVYESVTGSRVFAPRLYASAHHQIRAELWRGDGRAIRVLYQGPIGDSLDVSWDGLDSAATLVVPGNYFFVVQSLDESGRAERYLQLPLEVGMQLSDTLPHPQPPADSLMRDGRSTAGSSGGGLEALIGGLAIGTAVAVMPVIFAQEFDGSGARLAVGGAIAIGGIVAFTRRSTADRIPGTVATGEALRAQWRLEVDAAIRENERRRGQIVMRVRIGVPLSIVP